ncbi:AI-2E family transporter (plasmid) [Qingshengfaniella alkalisoli]|uniref:AI-2E family transporter n=1 Tax=Qingshengfaniella alkalisoli TaxID=2599296 RepID=A0A5B8JBX3_9RHOB|nr:AI-2E family transporter [Qingshengfaniella alkalisoli]
MLGLFLIAAVGALILARSFLMPVILAFMLSLTFSPIRRWLGRRGVPPYLTAFVVVLGLVGLLVGLSAVLSGPIQQYSRDRAIIMYNVEQKLRGLSETIEKISEASEEVQSIATGDAEGQGEEEPQEVVIKDSSLMSKAALTAPYMMAQITLALVLLFFLIGTGDLFYEKLVKASPTFADKRKAIKIAFDIEKKISRYFLTITVINACLGIVVGLCLWSVGMPNPLLFGVLAFALNFIPYLGAIAGVVLTFIIGLVSFDQVSTAVLAASLYLICTTLEGQFVTPYMVGRNLKLNPVVVFISVAFWGWAWSVIGMFIAVPVLLAIRSIAESVPSLQNIAIFLSGRDERPDQSEHPS